jgi:hypothetical protein
MLRKFLALAIAAPVCGLPLSKSACPLVKK